MRRRVQVILVAAACLVAAEARGTAAVGGAGRIAIMRGGAFGDGRAYRVPFGGRAYGGAGFGGGWIGRTAAEGAGR